MSKTGKAILLAKHSLKVLENHKCIFVFPFLGYLCKLAIFVSLITPFIHHQEYHLITQQLPFKDTVLLVLIFMLLLFAVNLVLFFFNTGILVNLLYVIRHKKEASISYGFKQAFKQYGRVFLWAHYAGIIGVILNLQSRKTEETSKIKQMLNHNHWSIASNFALTLMIDQKMGPHKALKTSAQLMHDHWGEYLRPSFSFSFLLLISKILACVPLLVGVIHRTHTSLITTTIITLLLLLCISTIQQMIRSVIRTAMYCYATDQITPQPFTKDILSCLFVSRKRRV